MAVLNSRALQEQLSAIMAALTKAAVMEICELVDEGYSMLQAEITRSRKENQDLRKKLHLIQSIVVRGGGGGEALVEPEVTEQGAPAPGAGGAGGAMEEELPEVVLIKDEDSDVEESEDGPGASVGGAAAAREAVTPLPISQRARRRRAGHVGDRSVQVQPSVKLCKVTLANAAGYELDSPGGDLSFQHAADPLCSYGSQGAPDIQPEGPLVSTGAEHLSYFGDGGPMEPDPTRAELDFSQMWDKPLKGHLTFEPGDSPDGDAFGIKLVSVAGSMSTDSQLSESGSSGFEYENLEGAVFPLSGHPGGGGGRGKRFLCSVCNRTYATSQNLEVHMRIHTGERPFSCEQCGKKFTQSAHLKSHRSVHTGERPYPCSVCSRSFIVRYSLKLHMKKCHPNINNERRVQAGGQPETSASLPVFSLENDAEI